MKSLLPEWERRCTRFPDLPVVVDNGEVVTGAEFLARARALAEELAGAGVRQGDRVAASFEPSADLLLVLAAIWAAGASFVPLFPGDRSARATAILESAAPRLLLTSCDAMSPATRVPVAEVAAGRVRSLRPAAGDVEAGAGAPGEAYVIFTSGSTGRPKGVVVSHAALATYIEQARVLYGIDEAAPTVPVHLPATFDASLTAMVSPLVTRAVAVAVTDPLSRTRGLAAVLDTATEPVLVKITPAQARLLERFVSPSTAARLRGQFVLGGEALRYEDIDWLRDHAVGIFNEYGPTEATVGCVIHRIARDEPRRGPVPIGKPHQGASVSVLPDDPDGDHGSTRDGGELVVSGPCLAEGYLDGDPGGFCRIEGRWSYRTGDRVRVDDSGILHYLGRVDDLVKVNGFRVALAEVEAAMLAASGATAAAALAVNDTLVGFIDGSGPHRPLDAVRAGLRELLPGYMQPTALHVVPEIALTDHGKIDRHRLRRSLDTKTGPSRRDGPERPWRDLAAQAWTEVLGTAPATGGESFFTHGDSMAALRFTGRVSAASARAIPASLIFDHPTFDDFVTALERGSSGDRPPAAQPGAGPVLTVWQEAILRAESLETEPGSYTVVDAVAATGIDDWAAVRTAAAEVIARHPVFARALRRRADGRLDMIDAPLTPRLLADHIDIAVDDPDPAATLRAAKTTTLDLTHPGAAAPRLLVRPQPDPAAAGHWICALIAHHTVVDEHSARLLWSEIFRRAQGESLGAAGEFATWAREGYGPDGAVAARDAAAALTRHLLDTPMQHADLGDKPGRTATTRTHPITGEPALGDLAAAAARSGSTIAALCGAAAVHALGAQLGMTRFAVFMPMSLRRADTDFATVGCMVASVPVLAELPETGCGHADFVRQWRRSIGYSARHAGADPGVLHEALLAGDPGWASSPRLALVLETPHHGSAGPVRWESIPTADIAKFDLAINLRVDRGPHTGEGRIIYRSGPDTVIAAIAEAVARRYLDTVTRICHGQPLPPVDRRAPAASPAAAITESPASTAQSSEISAVVARLASAALGRAIRAEDDLLDAGARSLELLVLASSLQTELGVRLSAADILDHPTVAELTTLIADARTGSPVSTQEGIR
ncbi:AMP-binding protein [Nocardia sp. NPDC003482]